MLSYKTVRNVIKRLGYRYAKGTKGRVRFAETPKKKKQQYRYALEYSQAKQLEHAGTHKIVYLDESFCNTGHTNDYSWFPTKSEDGQEPLTYLAQPTGKGKL